MPVDCVQFSVLLNMQFDCPYCADAHVGYHADVRLQTSYFILLDMLESVCMINPNKVSIPYSAGLFTAFTSMSQFPQSMF